MTTARLEVRGDFPGPLTHGFFSLVATTTAEDPFASPFVYVRVGRTVIINLPALGQNSWSVSIAPPVNKSRFHNLGSSGAGIGFLQTNEGDISFSNVIVHKTGSFYQVIAELTERQNYF